MLRMILVLFLYTLGAVVGLRSVIVAACLWIWNDIFRPVHFARFWGILGSPYFLPVHICTGILVFALFTTRWRKKWNMGSGAVLILLFWVWITTWTAQLPETALTEAVATTKYLVPLIPISLALCYRRAQEFFLYALGLSVGIWIIHHGIITVLPGAAQIQMAIPGGQMTDRNDFTVAATGCLSLLVFMGWHYEGPMRRLLRWFLRFGAVLTVGAIVYSLSRGSMVGLALLGAWYAFGTGRVAKRAPTFVLVGILGLALVPDVAWERLGTINLEGEQTEGSAVTRLRSMRVALRITQDFPVFGVGPDCYADYASTYGAGLEPHTIWLKCSAEHGIPMLVFFLGFVLVLLWRLRALSIRSRRDGQRRTSDMATALSCAIVGFLASGSFTSQFLSQYLWAIMVLAAAFLASPADDGERVPGMALFERWTSKSAASPATAEG